MKTQNKAIVHDAFEEWRAGADVFGALLAPDVVWTIFQTLRWPPWHGLCILFRERILLSFKGFESPWGSDSMKHGKPKERAKSLPRGF